MGRTAVRERNKRRIRKVALYRERVGELRAIIKDRSCSMKDRWLAYRKLRVIPRDAFATRVRNLCVITSRSRSVYKDFAVSRVVLRKQALWGNMPGIFKGSL